MKRVQVLLSAYNGEKYIAQQIESILRQKHVQVFLLIRDDGSKDTTWNIVSGYAALYENMDAYAGNNIGTQKSYFDLLAHADADMDYYAFSDQDDVWHEKKLKRAVEILNKQSKKQPLLYASNVIYASEDLRIKKRVCYLKQIRPSFGNALLENVCIGCTQVFNRRLLELAHAHPPRCGILHDWWFYMTAACFGKVCFDNEAYILYRQHGHNQVGMADTRWKRWKHRIQRLWKMHGMLSGQAADFADAYKKMLEENREVELLAGYRQDAAKKREFFRLLKKGVVYRQDSMDQCMYKVLLLAGYL